MILLSFVTAKHKISLSPEFQQKVLSNLLVSKSQSFTVSSSPQLAIVLLGPIAIQFTGFVWP